MRSRVQPPIVAPFLFENMIDHGNFPNAFYRVGVKAVIRNETDQVLCVHDTGDDDMWSLPGGGLDHGDDIKSGLAREFVEEIDYSGEFSMEFRDTCIYYSRAIGAHVLYMIFDVELHEAYEPRAGVDARNVSYLEESDLLNYSDRQAEIIRKYGFGQQVDIPIYK